MKAIFVGQLGGPELFTLQDISSPQGRARAKPSSALPWRELTSWMSAIVADRTGGD
jgi:hypothetical protein